MAIRLQAEFSDLEGLEYQINIHDDTFGGTVVPFVLGGDGFYLGYEGNTETRFEPVIGSYVEFSLVEQNDDHSDFLTDLITSSEGRFLLEIRLEPDGVNTLFWAGVILADQLLMADEARPIENRLRASDDLANLRDVLFVDTDGTGYTASDGVTFAQQLALAFKKVRSASLWGAGDTFMRLVASFTPGNIYGSGDYYSNLRVNHQTWWNFDEETGAPKYFSTLYVLQQFGIALNARMYLANGTFWLVPNFRAVDSATLAALQYNKAGTYLSSTNVSTGLTIGTDVRKLRGWQWGYQVPLKVVDRVYNYRGTDLLLVGTFYPKSELGTTISTDNEFALNSGTKLQVQIVGQWVPDPDGPTTNGGSTNATYNLRRKYSVKIKCGIYYAKRVATFAEEAQLPYVFGAFGTTVNFLAATYSDITWTTNSADRVEVVGYSQWVTYSPNPNQILTVNLPELPAVSAGIEAAITMTIVDKDGLTVAGQYSATDPWTALTLRNIDNNGNSILYRATSSNANTVVLQQDACVLGDSAENSNYGLIQVRTGASTWDEVTTWTSPTLTTGTQDIHSIGVRDILFGQSTPRLRQLGQVMLPSKFVVPMMYSTFSFDSRRYAIYTLNYSARERIVDLELFELFASSSGTTVAVDGPIRRGRRLGDLDGITGQISELEDAVKAGTISTVTNGTQDGVIDVLKAAVKTTASEVELVKDASNKVTVTDSAITHTVDGATRAQITTAGMAITGSITVTGTVDGVDVAALKTTVDGITAGSATEPKFWAFYLAD